ncbi:MAG: hypothetical protein ACRC5C_08895 [Bacilli bacterium]
MKQRKMETNKIIYAIASVLLITGIALLALYIPAQMQIINDASTQGATAEQISDYVWKQMMPQLLMYVLLIIGFSSTLAVGGIIIGKLDQLFVSQPTTQRSETKRVIQEDEVDDWLSEFEEVNGK